MSVQCGLIIGFTLRCGKAPAKMLDAVQIVLWPKIFYETHISQPLDFQSRDVNETRETQDSKKFLGIEKCFSLLLRIYNCAINTWTNDRRSVNDGPYAKPPALWPARELGVANPSTWTRW